MVHNGADDGIYTVNIQGCKQDNYGKRTENDGQES